MTDIIKPGYLRVTTLLSAFSGLDRIDPFVLKRASCRGTVVHQAIDSIIAFHGLLGLEEQVREYTKCPDLMKWHDEYEKELAMVHGFIESFRKWSQGKKFLPKPTRLYDDYNMITGEFDVLYKDQDGLLTLVDFKTPASESKTWMLQGTGYDILSLHNGVKIDKIEFVKLCRKGNPPKSYFYERNVDLFLSVLETYRYFKLEGCQDIEIDYI